MSVVRFIADQRTNYGIAHAFVCRLLGLSESWFYKWHARATSRGAQEGLFIPGPGWLHRPRAGRYR